MKDILSPERIKKKIEYKQKQLKEMNETITFYKKIGAEKDFSWEQEQLKSFENEIKNLTDLLENGQNKIDGLKVRVTEYKGRIVIESIKSEDFDHEFDSCGGGSIGCSLYNNERLGMSKEAVQAISSLKRVGDSIGDFMNGDSSYFSWIGGAFSIKDSNSVLSRDFNMPTGYVVIENETSDKAKEEIDYKIESGKIIDYKDLEHDIWIEINQHSYWGPKDGEPSMSEHKESDFYTVEVKIHKKYVDADLNILNAPEGCVYPYQMYRGDDNGRQCKLSDDEYAEIIGLAKGCFNGMEGEYKGSYGWNTSGYVIPKDQVMSFVNGLFKVGFDNNIMNPRLNYWRMSMTATTSKIKDALKRFKRM